MSSEIEVSTQGISDDLAQANGDYGATEWGAMAPSRLGEFFTRVRQIQPPQPQAGEDPCPPHVLTHGAGGQLSFLVGGGSIDCHGIDLSDGGRLEIPGLTPEEAAGLASGALDAIELHSAKHPGEPRTDARPADPAPFRPTATAQPSPWSDAPGADEGSPVSVPPVPPSSEQKASLLLVILGFLFSLLISLVGLIIGGYIWGSKIDDGAGGKMYRFADSSRNLGVIMIVISGLSLGLGIILQMF